MKIEEMNTLKKLVELQTRIRAFNEASCALAEFNKELGSSYETYGKPSVLDEAEDLMSGLLKKYGQEQLEAKAGK